MEKLGFDTTMKTVKSMMGFLKTQLQKVVCPTSLVGCLATESHFPMIFFFFGVHYIYVYIVYTYHTIPSHPIPSHTIPYPIFTFYTHTYIYIARHIYIYICTCTHVYMYTYIRLHAIGRHLQLKPAGMGLILQAIPS